MFLTAQQIEDLTGYKQKSRQIRWLMENRIRFFRNKAGYPKVCQTDIQQGNISRPGSRKAPNFDILNA